MSNTAQDIMTKNVIVVDEDSTINHLVELFLKHRISCAPVVNKNKELVGIITKTDVLGYFLDLDLDVSIKVALKDILEYSSEPCDTEISHEKPKKVRNIMTPDPITTDENTTIKNLAETMVDHNIHRLVIEKDGDIVGIVSTLDILHHVAEIDKNE